MSELQIVGVGEGLLGKTLFFLTSWSWTRDDLIFSCENLSLFCSVEHLLQAHVAICCPKSLGDIKNNRI